MGNILRFNNIFLAIIVVLLNFIFVESPIVNADGKSENLEILSYSATSEFPDGISFTADFSSNHKLQEIKIYFKSGPQSTVQYAYMDLKELNGKVTGELFYRTNSIDRYLPPGTNINYWFTGTTESGLDMKTESYSFTYNDSRYKWNELSSGPVTILFHGPMKTRAERLSEAVTKCLEIMGPITGAEIETPITMTLYNNNAEMIGAVQSRSMATSRELITEGQAFYSESVVLVLAGRRDIGTATHEITHILVGRAGGSSGQVPLWLNEGLAEYGNMDKSISYDRFLEWAMDTNRLLPLSHLNRFPGDANLTLVAYGQARSVVDYMITKYGTDSMANLLSLLKSGQGINSSLEEVYGIDLEKLESDWRESIGAPPYVPPKPKTTDLPAAEPTPGYKLFTLSPDSEGTDVSMSPIEEDSLENNLQSKELEGSCTTGGRSDLAWIGLLLMIFWAYGKTKRRV